MSKKKMYLCVNCGIVEDFVYYDKELDCDLCEDCCEYKDNMEEL